MIVECEKLVTLGVRDLDELCSELASNQSRYIPRLSVGVVSLVGRASPLVQLKELVNNSLFVQEESFSEFTDFLAELVCLTIDVVKYSHECSVVNLLLYIDTKIARTLMHTTHTVLQPECACQRNVQCILW